jgi:hypothetical protein
MHAREPMTRHRNPSLRTCSGDSRRAEVQIKCVKGAFPSPSGNVTHQLVDWCVDDGAFI